MLLTEGYFIKGLHTTKFWTILGVVLTEITVPIAKILSGKNTRCLAGSSKMAPRIFIFSIVVGAEYLPYVKSIQTHACAFLPLNILAIGTVYSNEVILSSRFVISGGLQLHFDSFILN